MRPAVVLCGRCNSKTIYRIDGGGEETARAQTRCFICGGEDLEVQALGRATSAPEFTKDQAPGEESSGLSPEEWKASERLLRMALL